MTDPPYACADALKAGTLRGKDRNPDEAPRSARPVRASRLIVALTLLAAIAVPAAGQAGFPSGRIRQGYYGPEELSLQQGGNATFNLEFSRECTDRDLVLPEARLEISFAADIPITLSGASQVTFPDQVCATDSMVAFNETYSLSVPLNTSLGAHNVTIQAILAAGVTGTSPGGADDLSLNFEVTPATPGPDTTSAPSTTEDPVPGFGLVLALLACLGVALAWRRGKSS